jgi:hypothetical protein
LEIVIIILAAKARLLGANLPDAAECAEQYVISCDGKMGDGKTSCPYKEICKPWLTRRTKSYE